MSGKNMSVASSTGSSTYFTTSSPSVSSSAAGTKTTSGSRTQESSEFTDHKVVSVFYSNGLLGASYYAAETLDIRMTPQIPDSGFYLYQLEQLLNKLQPSTIIISRTAHRHLENTVMSFIRFNNSVTLEKVSPQQMQSAAAEQALLSLNLQGRPDGSFSDCTSEEKMSYLTSVLDFSQEKSLKSLGALLHCVKARFQTADAPVIASLGMHEACGRLSVSLQTLRDLHIVSEESHPCFWQGATSRRREGLSVLSLFTENCTIGRSRLRSMFSAPLNEMHRIKERLDMVENFIGQQELCESLQRSLAKIKRIDRVLLNMSQALTTVPEWKILRDTCQNLLVVHDQFSSASNLLICPKTRCAVETSCRDVIVLQHMINRTIDFEGFQDDSSFPSPVKAGISVELDERKKQYFGRVNDQLTARCLEQVSKLPESVCEGRISYMPCWGFLFVTGWENEETVQREEGVELVCKMDNAVLFSTPITRTLDAEYGDMRNLIIHQESEICRALQREVLSKVWQLLETIDKLCTLDAILALATTARNRGFTKPEITSENEIVVHEGYHPLLELTKPRGALHVQPNSFMSDVAHSVTVVTGANSCGKSVYLRQNALIVLLAHVGSFVPAEKSEISLLDTIQSSFFVNETMRDEASSFALQCRQIASIEKSIESGRAFVVIDEFGKGTSTAEGAGLSVALLEAFVAHQNKPHVLFASHYSKHLHNFLKDCPQVQFVTFSHHIDQDNLVQLHRIVHGVSERSFANFAAAQAGLPNDLLKMQERILASLENCGKFVDTTSRFENEFSNFLRQVLEDVRHDVEYMRAES